MPQERPSNGDSRSEAGAPARRPACQVFRQAGSPRRSVRMSDAARQAGGVIATIRRMVPGLAMAGLIGVVAASGSSAAQPDEVHVLKGGCSPTWSGESTIPVGHDEAIVRMPVSCDTALVAVAARSRVTIGFTDGGPATPVIASYSGEPDGGLPSGPPVDGEVAFDVDRFAPPGADHPSATRDGRCVLTFKSGEPAWIQCGAKVVEGGVVKAATVTFDVLPGQWRRQGL